MQGVSVLSIKCSFQLKEKRKAQLRRELDIAIKLCDSAATTEASDTEFDKGYSLQTKFGKAEKQAFPLPKEEHYG